MLDKGVIELGLMEKHWMFAAYPDHCYPTSFVLADHQYGYAQFGTSPGSIAHLNH